MTSSAAAAAAADPTSNPIQPDQTSAIHPLITQTLVDTKKYYCPFFERGYCRKSSQCTFSHDQRVSIKIPNHYCHFYLANQCFYGQECKFRHSEPPPASTSSSSSSSNLLPSSITTTPHAATTLPLDPITLITSTVLNYHHHHNQQQQQQQQAGTSSSDPSAEPIHVRYCNASLPERFENNAPSTSRLIAGKYFKRPLDERTVFGDDANLTYDDRNDDEEEDEEEDEDDSYENANYDTSGYTYEECITSAETSASRLGENSCDDIQNNNNEEIETHNSDVEDAVQNDENDYNTDNGESTSSFKRPQHNRPRPALSNRHQVAMTSSTYSAAVESAPSTATEADKYPCLCPYASTQGVCPFPYNICPYTHGLVCDLCSRACLHPDDLEQQRQHREDCLREHEREMELSFAVQRSKDKVCGICMDTVIEKKPITSSRFGILEKCNHVFCLDCIRKWRGTKQFDNRTIRACPECRVSSDFVVPSKFWVEDQDDKEKLIRDYKTALQSKPCRYFDEGKGECPFAGSCFYKHAYPDGRLAKPEPPRPRRRLQGARGSATRERMTNLILWNILTSGEDDWHLSTEELDTFYFDRDWDPEMTDGEEDSDIDIEW